MSARLLSRIKNHAAAWLAALVLLPAAAQFCPTPPVSTSYVPPINTYYPGTGPSVSAGSSAVPVATMDVRGSLTPIAAGDVVLVIQMQSADITFSNNNR